MSFVCAVCRKPMVRSSLGPCETTVGGFMSPPGHDHNDNCLTLQFHCENGHTVVLSRRRCCSAPGCAWVGKEECFCHAGKKLDEWPDGLPDYSEEVRR